MGRNRLDYIFVFLLTVAIFYHAQLDVAAEEEEEGAPDMPCQAAVSKLLKRQMEGISRCTKTMKFKNGKDKAAKFNCILKCVATTEGILTPESLLDKETVSKFIKKEIPKNLMARAAPIVWACYDQSEGKLDPTEEFCESYKPMIKCIMDAIPKFCKQQ